MSRRATPENNLAIKFPEIAKQWHPTKNGTLTPNDILPGSNKKIWWLCDICSYEWITKPALRTLKHKATGCPQCSKRVGTLKRSSNTDIFKSKAIKKHGDRYDYSKVEYVNAFVKVIITCKDHGEFLQTPSDHLSGYGCSGCGRQTVAEKKRSNIFEFISKALKVHGDIYDYSLVSYKNSWTHVPIVCKIHGIFYQSPNKHLSGRRCPKCANQKRAEAQCKTTEQFINEAKNIHNNDYDYSLVNYINSYHKVIIICKKHGQFMQLPVVHLIGSGCQKCTESSGERIVRKILDKHKLEFKQECSFEDCRFKAKLKFDFCVYIDNKKYLIEYNGQQHYDPIFDWYGESAQQNLLNTQARDKIKQEWANRYHIPLLVIPYWDKDNIEQLISEFLNLTPVGAT